MNKKVSGWKNIPISVERQKKAHYCWVSVTKAVLTLLDENFEKTQEQIANEILGEDNNKFMKIGDVLSHFGVLRTRKGAPLEMNEIQKEIEGGLPVIARIDWLFGGGHVVVITGCNDEDGLKVKDPLYGFTETNYTNFRENYLNFGVWSHSYLIRKNITL